MKRIVETPHGPRMVGACKRSPFTLMTLFLSHFGGGLADPPEQADWRKAYDATGNAWGEHMNTTVGCCVIAAEDNTIQARTAAAGNVRIVTDDETVMAYMRVSDWNGVVNDPSDTGCNPDAALKDWRKNGVADHKIGAYLRIDPKNIRQVKQAIANFEGIQIAVELPDAWLRTAPGGTWDVSAGVQPDPENGHGLAALAYDAGGVWVKSWGMDFYITWKAFVAVSVQADATIADDMLAADGSTPEGFDAAALRAALATL